MLSFKERVCQLGFLYLALVVVVGVAGDRLTEDGVSGLLGGGTAGGGVSHVVAVRKSVIKLYFLFGKIGSYS